MQILLRLLGFSLKYKKRLLVAYICTIAVTAFALAIPWILGIAVDEVIESGEVGPLIFLAALILVISVLRGVAAYGQQYLGEALGQRVAYDIRNTFYERLQRLSFGFHDNQRSGDLMSRATADVEGVRMFIQGGVIRGGYMVLLILGVSVILIISSWKLALMSLVFVPFIILRTATIMLEMRRNWMAERTEMGHLNTVLQENLAGQRVVKAFAAEDLESEKFNYHASEVARYGFTAERLQAHHNIPQQLLPPRRHRRHPVVRRTSGGERKYDGRGAGVIRAVHGAAGHTGPHDGVDSKQLLQGNVLRRAHLLRSGRGVAGEGEA